MGNAGDVSVGLILEGADEFRVQVTRAADSLDRIASKMESYERATDRVRGSSSRVATGVREMALNLELARMTIANLTTGLVALPKAILDQASFFDKTTLLLAGLNSETTNFAQAQALATRQLDGLLNAAAASPYKVTALVDAYTKLKAADIANADGFLAGLVNTAGKFGKSSEELKRAAVAIQQMAGKGVISMEELRQQFGEAVPDAMGMMARAAGISMGDLVKQVSTGTVEAKQALALLSREMYLSSAGAAESMSQTWEGALNRITTSLTQLAKTAGDTGFYKDAVSSANSFNDFLNSDEAAADAARIGLALRDLTDAVGSAAKFLYDNTEEIALAIATLFSASWATKARDGVKAAIEAYKIEAAKWPESTRAVQQEMLVLQQEFQRRGLDLEAQYLASKTKAQDKIILAAMDANKAQYDVDRNALEQRLQLLKSGQSRLSAVTNSVVGMFGGWTNVIVAAIGVAIYALDEFYLKQRRIADQLVETQGLVASFDDLTMGKKQIQEDNDKIESLRKQKASAEEYTSELIKQKGLTAEQVAILKSNNPADYYKKLGIAQSVGKNGADGANFVSAFNRSSQLDKEISEIENRVKQYENAVASAQTHVNETLRSNGAAMATNIMATRLREISMEYDTAAKDASRKATEAAAKYKGDADKSKEVYKKALNEALGPSRVKAMEEFNNAFKKQAQDVQSQIDAIKTAGTKDDKGNLVFTPDQQKQMLVLQGRLEGVNDEWGKFKEAVSVSHEGLDRIAQQMAKTGKLDPLSGYIQSTEIYNAGKREEINLAKVSLGLADQQIIKGKEVAKLEAAIAAGKFKGNAAQLEQARVVAAARDMQNQELRDMSERARLRRTSVDRLDDLSISVSKKMGTAGAKTDNPFMDWMQSAEQTNEAIKEIEANLRKASGVMDEDVQKIEEIRQKQRMMDQSNIRASLEKSIQSSQESMLPAQAKLRLEYSRQISQLNELLAAEQERLKVAIEAGAPRAEETKAIEKNIELIQKQKALAAEQNAAETTFAGMFKKSVSEMSDSVTEKLEQAFVGVFDALAEGIVEGKASFTDMIDSLAKDLEKFFVKLAMMRAVEAGMSAIGFADGGVMTSSGPTELSAFANGGIMTEYGSVPLRKYANGGIATTPQLALFGEGSMNEAYVPLPDGRTIPVTMTSTGNQQSGSPNVQFNLINQSGTAVEPEQSGARFDGENYIIDVVLKALNRPGRLRTAVQGANK